MNKKLLMLFLVFSLSVWLWGVLVQVILIVNASILSRFPIINIKKIKHCKNT